MSEDFYTEWLGIPRGTRPPDHYTLLGLNRFCRDIDKIENSVRDRLDLLDEYGIHPNIETRDRASDMMNEIARARVDLVDTKRRDEYEQGLAERLGLSTRRKPARPEPVSEMSAVPEDVPVDGDAIKRFKSRVARHLKVFVLTNTEERILAAEAYAMGIDNDKAIQCIRGVARRKPIAIFSAIAAFVIIVGMSIVWYNDYSYHQAEFDGKMDGVRGCLKKCDLHGAEGILGTIPVEYRTRLVYKDLEAKCDALSRLLEESLTEIKQNLARGLIDNAAAALVKIRSELPEAPEVIEQEKMILAKYVLVVRGLMAIEKIGEAVEKISEIDRLFPDMIVELRHQLKPDWIAYVEIARESYEKNLIGYGKSLLSKGGGRLWQRLKVIVAEAEKARLNGRYLDSVEKYRMAEDLLPNASKHAKYVVLVSGARQLTKTGEYDKALKTVQDALLLRPDDRTAIKIRQRINAARYQALVETARLIMKEGQFQKALQAVNAALEIQPKGRDAILLVKEINDARCEKLIAIARPMFEKGQLAEALSEVNVALQIQPKDKAAVKLAKEINDAMFLDRMKNARLNLETGKFQMALKDVELALELRPKDSEALFLSSMAMTRLNMEKSEYRNASLHVNAALGFRAKDRLALLLKKIIGIRLRLDDGKLDVALRNAKEIARAYPDEKTALVLRDEIMGQMAKAEVDSILVNTRVLLKKGKTSDALVAIEKALKLHPGNATALKWKGVIQEAILKNIFSQKIKTVTMSTRYRVNGFSFISKGKVLVTMGYSGIGFWSMKTGKKMREIYHDFFRSDVTCSPNGKVFAGRGQDRSEFVVWRSSGTRVCAVKSDGVHAFSPDSSLVAIDEKVVGVVIWDIKKGKLKVGIKTEIKYPRYFAFSPDGKKLAIGFSYGGVGVWDVGTGNKLHHFKGRVKDNYTSSYYVQSLAISPNGKVLVAGDRNGAINMWDIETGKELRVMTGHVGNVCSLNFSPDNAILASGGDDTEVILWNIATGRPLVTFKEHEYRVTALAFSPNGKLFVSGGYRGKIILWKMPKYRGGAVDVGRIGGGQVRAKAGSNKNGKPNTVNAIIQVASQIAKKPKVDWSRLLTTVDGYAKNLSKIKGSACDFDKLPKGADMKGLPIADAAVGVLSKVRSAGRSRPTRMTDSVCVFDGDLKMKGLIMDSIVIVDGDLLLLDTYIRNSIVLVKGNLKCQGYIFNSIVITGQKNQLTVDSGYIRDSLVAAAKIGCDGYYKNSILSSVIKNTSDMRNCRIVAHKYVYSNVVKFPDP